MFSHLYYNTTVNKSSVIFRKIVFVLKYEIVLANSAFPEIDWFPFKSFCVKPEV